MIHVIDVQSRATIQDLGRFGLRRFGISQCEIYYFDRSS